MSIRDLNPIQRCVLEIIWLQCWILGHMPHFVLYRIIAPIIRLFAYRILGYRRKVVETNLANSFPDKSAAERRKICGDFYTVLSEIIVSYASMTNHKMGFDIVRFLDSDDPECAERMRALMEDQSWIALAAHYGLWEYLLFWTNFSSQYVVGVYHPLRNKIFDELFKRLRRRSRVVPVPAKESTRFVFSHRTRYNDGPYVLGLIADQNPPLLPDSHWFTFLGQDTIFFDGGEKLALRVGLPVNFVYQRRLGRGRYEFLARPIWDGVESVEPNEIIKRYVEALEQEIHNNPHLWLWSHRRWKVKREGHYEPWMAHRSPQQS